MTPSRTLQPCRFPAQPSRLLPSSRRTKPSSVLNSSARAGAAVRQARVSKRTHALEPFIRSPLLRQGERRHEGRNNGTVYGEAGCLSTTVRVTVAGTAAQFYEPNPNTGEPLWSFVICSL